MSTLVNPASGRTFRHERLLSTLMDWSGEKRIVAAMLRAQRASPGALRAMAHELQRTVETRGEKGMSEEKCARLLLIFLKDRTVRRVIAAYVSGAHGIAQTQVMRDLWAMRQELREVTGQDPPAIAHVGG